MQTNRHDEGDVNELAHTTRRVFCTDLLLSSAGLLLAATAATKDVAAQDSTVAYPARKIEGAEALLPGSSLYFNYPTRNDPAVCCALVRAKGVQPQMISRGVFGGIPLPRVDVLCVRAIVVHTMLALAT